MSPADVIIVSSTERPSTYTPPPPAYTSEELFDYSPPRSSSPLSLVSPSELFRPASRSKYFQSPCSRKKANEEPKNRSGREGAAAITTKGDMTEDKPKRRRKKPADEPQAAVQDLGPTVLAPKANVSKSTAKSKKPRANNATKRAESGNKTLKGRVAKRGSTDAEKGKKTVAPLSSTASKGHDAQVQEADGLHLDGAMSRRLDWTPPKGTSKPVIELDHERSPENNGQSTSLGFGNLVSAYNFSGTSCATRDNLQISEDGGPTKRRRIELVNPSVLGKTPADENSQHSSAQDRKKPKRQGKKINTLTARVTARYGDAMDEDEAREIHQPVRRGKSKKTKDSEFTVLSPEAAAKTLDEQDLVFGTCSQLEREDSPTLLRDMQMAIHVSEVSVAQERRMHPSKSLGSGSTISRFAAPRNLWSVAARDQEGCLAQAEVVDMVDESDAPQVPPKSGGSRKEVEGKQRWECVDLEMLEDAQSNKPREEMPISNKAPVEHQQPTVQAVANAGQSGKDISKNEESCPPMPQYSGFTDSELSRQIATYGFKPLKSRQKMIDLLQKCWESKYGPNTKFTQEDLLDGPTAKSTIPQPSKMAQKTTKLKSKSKTPSESIPREDISTIAGRKPATKRQQKETTRPAPTQKVEEIEDSEEEVIPSPSRLHTRYTSTDNQPLPVSTAQSPTRSSRTDPSSRTSLPDLAAQITKAVRAQRRSISSGRTRPSWHEKILMYDPIILEDFAAWLNIEGLGAIDEDREVGAGFVREWCESKGICCCWKKSEGR